MKVGEYTYGSELINVRSWGEGTELIIGKFCSIAPCTVYLGGNHNTGKMTTYPFGIVHNDVFKFSGGLPNATTNGNVIIGNDVWIGEGAVIMSGVRIGDGAVVGANSHVVRDIAPYSIVMGNPADTVMMRFDTIVIQKLLELKWWDWPIEKIRANLPTICGYFKETLKQNTWV